MEWHWSDALSIFHHFPHSLGDLLHHENPELVKAGLPGLILTGKAPVTTPVVLSGATSSSSITLEKDIDPAIARSQQNFGLLIRDYLHTLPEYKAETHQGEVLLEHWRNILLEQPQRLAEAHLDSWNNERSRHFWHERLSHYSTDFGIVADHFPNAMDDWERSAGTIAPDPKTLGILKTHQWQDLVIRQRLHKLDIDNMSRFK